MTTNLRHGEVSAGQRLFVGMVNWRFDKIEAEILKTIGQFDDEGQKLDAFRQLAKDAWMGVDADIELYREFLEAGNYEDVLKTVNLALAAKLRKYGLRVIFAGLGSGFESTGVLGFADEE